MKQHAVPENIMDVEFKLFGSLTAKQFGYIIGGGCIALLMYYTFKTLNSTLLGWIFAFLCVILGLSLALIRVNDQPFEVWLGNFLSAMFSSQKRVWKKGKKTPEVLTQQGVEQKKEIVRAQQSAPLQVATQAQQEKKILPPKPSLQPGPSIPEHPFKDIQTENQQKQVIQAPGKVQAGGVAPRGPVVQSQLAGTAVQGDTYYIPGSAQKYIKMSTNQSPNRPLTVSTQSGTLDQRIKSDMIQPQKVQTQKSDQVQQTPSTLLNEGNGVSATTSSPPPHDEPAENVGNKQEPKSDTQAVSAAPVVSQQSGQVGTGNVSDQTQQASIEGAAPVLQQPVQAPQVAQTNEGKTYTNKGLQYGDLIPEKGESTTDHANDDSSGAISSDDQLAEENKALRQKVAEYSEEKAKLEEALTQTKRMHDELQSQNLGLSEKLGGLQRELEALKVKEEEPKPAAPTKQIPKEQEDSGLMSPGVYSGPSLSKKPNVISGIVKTKDGKLLPGVIVIVKNDKGRPVRAMKTNSLGQFVTTTALDNGVYLLELARDSYSFARYEIRLTGDLLPTYEIESS
ncbi:PrgI family protein [Candidatus Dojkabacteria bacterium]|nr:PrgI family protein [Candidatus Dojkabacteria bacterium]